MGSPSYQSLALNIDGLESLDPNDRASVPERVEKAIFRVFWAYTTWHGIVVVPVLWQW